MFKAMFQNHSRYFMAYVVGHEGQLFASIASMFRWLDHIGIRGTWQVEVRELTP